MILQSLSFVGVVTLIIVISLAIPTLSLHFPTKRGGGQPQAGISQIPISPYRGIFFYAWILWLILAFNGGKAALPAMDWGNFPQFHRTSHTASAVPSTRSQGSPTSAPPTVVAPAAPSTTATPPAATGPSVSASDQSETNSNPRHEPTPGQRRRWGPSGSPDGGSDEPIL